MANEWNVSVFESERKITFRIPTHECEGKVKMCLEEVAYYDSAGSALSGPSKGHLWSLSTKW